jgi:hypothetical protein
MLAGFGILQKKGTSSELEFPFFAKSQAAPRDFKSFAEEEGFEPPVHGKADNGFQDRRIRPLCHSSVARKITFFLIFNLLFTENVCLPR